MTNTNAVVMNNRFVYVMPGSNTECQKGQSLSILTLDSGSSRIFTGDKLDKNYGLPMA